MRPAGSWCSGQMSGLSLQGGRAESRTLDHQRPPGPKQYQLARALPEISISTLNRAPPNGQQAPVLEAPCQTTSNTGIQHHPLAERLPKVILSSQTPENTPPDAALPTRRTRYTPPTRTQAPVALTRKPTQPLNQPHTLGEDTKNNRNYEPAACEKETPNTVS